jgi:protein involved in polysaccharide export with SLBB domain
MIICPLVLSVIGAAAGLTTAVWNIIQIYHRKKQQKITDGLRSSAASIIQRYQRHRSRKIKYGAFEYTIDEDSV